jgi:hypothetical protein
MLFSVTFYVGMRDVWMLKSSVAGRAVWKKKAIIPLYLLLLVLLIVCVMKLSCAIVSSSSRYGSG